MNYFFENLKYLYKQYIGENLYFPDQFGNIIPLIVFNIFLIFFLLYYYKKIKIIKILFAIFATTFLLKSIIFYTPISSCARQDADGYTEIAKSMFNKKYDLDSKLTYNKEQTNQSLISFDGRIYFLKGNKIYEIDKKNNYKIINTNINLEKIFVINKEIYFTDTNNNLFITLNIDLKKYKKIYSSNSKITHLQIFNNQIFISNIKGEIININSNKIINDYNIPIKFFLLEKNLLFINDFYNKIKTFDTIKNIYLNEIILSNEVLAYDNSLDVKILKSKNTSLSLIQDIFLEYAKKNYEIKEIKKYKNYFIFIFYNGKVAKLNNLLEAKEISISAKNRHDLDKNLIFYNLFFYEQNNIIVNHTLIANNFDGDLLFFNLEKNEIITKFNIEKNDSLYKFQNIQFFKDAIRLPGYPLISGFLMKVTNKFDACNIVAFQNLIFFLMLLCLLFVKGIKPIFFIILMILLADPYNHQISMIVLDFPHFFEMVIFSLYIFLNIYYEKKYFFILILLLSLVILSSIISTKILVAMSIFHATELFYFIFFKKISNLKKNFHSIILIIFIISSYFVMANYFPGQYVFNKRNINQKFISYLMMNNSNSFEINEVNNFKRLLKLPVESEITYGGSGLQRFYTYSVLSDHLAGFANKYPKPIININTGRHINTISPNILNTILENKTFFFKDIINNFLTSLPVLFSISKFQEKNKFILFVSFGIFCIGLGKSYKLYKNYNIILFFSLVFLYLFYCFFLTPFSRFMTIYSIYLHSIYIIGIYYILKYINNNKLINNFKKIYFKLIKKNKIY